MNVTIFYKQNENDKSFKSAKLPAPVDAFAFQAFVEKSETAALVMSELWTKSVEPTFKHIDRLEVTDYDVTRQVNGEAVSFAGKSVIRNLNIEATLKGLADYKAKKAALEAQFASLKAMLKQAVESEVIGYESGKRGRKSNKLSQADALKLAMEAMKAVKA